MKQLLVIGETILAAGYFFDDADELRVYRDPEMTECDAIYPHHVMEGYGIAEADVPDEFRPEDYLWQGEVVAKPSPAASQDDKNAKIAQVEALAASKRDSVVAPTSPAEMASWPIKRDEAIKFKASITTQFPDGDPTAAPNLNDEATKRGITLSALADKVIAKANQLAALEAQIAGNTGRHNDAIKALATVDAINAYDFSGGWPV